jgi:hypothetical protein
VTATGTWHNKHACNGNPQQWQKVLTVGGPRRLTVGKATGRATARITAHGHTVRTVRWSAPILLTK